MNPAPIVVTGLPRCGSSLVMQMLSAAGVRCNGSYPGFEAVPLADGEPINPFTSIPETETYSPEFVREMAGGAFKLLDPHRCDLPEGFSYRFIFLYRSKRQQALSHLKMLRVLGAVEGKITDEDIEEYRKSLTADTLAVFSAISRFEGAIIKIRFEDLIGTPGPVANRIAWFLNLDADAEKRMAACVRPRSSTVYPGMLETDLIRESQEGGNQP